MLGNNPRSLSSWMWVLLFLMHCTSCRTLARKRRKKRNRGTATMTRLLTLCSLKPRSLCLHVKASCHLSPLACNPLSPTAPRSPWVHLDPFKDTAWVPPTTERKGQGRKGYLVSDLETSSNWILTRFSGDEISIFLLKKPLGEFKQLVGDQPPGLSTEGLCFPLQPLPPPF